MNWPVYFACGRKKAYPNLREAYAGVRRSAEHGIPDLKPYKCPFCSQFHNAKVKVNA